MICKKCKYEYSENCESCPKCGDSHEHSFGKNSTDKKDNGSTFAYVNLWLIVGFNILYFLIMHILFNSSCSDYGYMIFGMILLGVIQLSVNIYLWIVGKTKFFPILVTTVFSVVLFLSINSFLVNI